MKKIKNSQQGFHIIEISIVIFVVAVIGLVGWYVVGKPNKALSPSIQNSTSVPQAPEIKTAQDLDTAVSVIDKLDAAGSLDDINNIEKELNSL